MTRVASKVQSPRHVNAKCADEDNGGVEVEVEAVGIRGNSQNVHKAWVNTTAPFFELPPIRRV